jgi:ankyrin repeat protein
MILKILLPIFISFNLYANNAQTISTKCQNRFTNFKEINEIIQFNRDINLDETDDLQMTPLHWCALKGKSSIVELLLQKGANADALNNNKRSALIFAAKNGYTKIVKSLLATGATKNFKDVDGFTAVDWANRAGYYKIVAMIGERPENLIPFNKADVRESYLLIKRVVTKEVSLDFFKQHWKYGALIDDPVNRGRTVLIIAAHQGKIDLLKAVLNMGADPDIATKRGITALMAASGAGKLKAARILINRGADPNLKDMSGKTALDYATGDAKLSLIDFIDAYEEENKRTKSRIVEYLREYKRPKAMALLVKKHMKEIKVMAKKDRQQKRREENALKAMESKNSRGLSDIAYPGREKGNRKSPYISWAAFNAVWSEDYGWLNKLINQGLSLEVNDKNGNSLLHLSISKGHKAISDLLVRSGANINARNKFGNTPLMLAARYNKVPAVFYLIDNGANKRLRNKKGWTAARFARQARNKRTFNALRF